MHDVKITFDVTKTTVNYPSLHCFNATMIDVEFGLKASLSCEQRHNKISKRHYK